MSSSTTTTDLQNENSNQSTTTINKSNNSKHIIIIHLDLGIGGAEQLILQLATASIDNTNNTNTVEIMTSRCESNHCFDLVKPITGKLYPFLQIYGQWIPHNISLSLLSKTNNTKRYCTALFSTIRLFYLCYIVILRHYCIVYLQQTQTQKYDTNTNENQQKKGFFTIGASRLITVRMVQLILHYIVRFVLYCIIYHPTTKNSSSSSIDAILVTYKVPDIIVLDVLSTPLPLIRYLLPQVCILFYCHFPDKLLVRQNQNQQTQNQTPKKGFYRQFLDKLEEYTMIYTDITVVNSNFTKNTVYSTFPYLKECNKELPVLYPALEIQPIEELIGIVVDENEVSNKLINIVYNKKNNRQRKLIVSLNRYERKKNLSLFINSIEYICKSNTVKDTIDLSTIDFIIAGGYDISNIENVEYYNELQLLVNNINSNSTLKTKINIQFLQSISDQVRTKLLQEAIAVIYTPDNEHFGIVPLESMYYGTPVIACASGGPLETIVHNKTGYLCTSTSNSDKTTITESEASHVETFANAITNIIQLVTDSNKKNDETETTYKHMVSQCHYHVINKFGPKRFQEEWNALLDQTIEIGTKRYYEQQQQQQKQQNTIVFQIVCKIVPIILFVLQLLEIVLIYRAVRYYIQYVTDTQQRQHSSQEL